MDDLRNRRIDKATDHYRKVRLTIELRRIASDILADREPFADTAHRLRLPLPAKA